MNTRVAVFAIISFVLAFVLLPFCAAAVDPTEEQAACYAVGTTTLKACAEQAIPAIKTEADKEFTKSVCVAAAYRSQAMCLDQTVWTKYAAQGVCEGSGLFTRDAIANAGKDIVAEAPEAEREALLKKVEGWAGAAGTRIMLYCKEVLEREANETAL